MVHISLYQKKDKNLNSQFVLFFLVSGLFGSIQLYGDKADH